MYLLLPVVLCSCPTNTKDTVLFSQPNKKTTGQKQASLIIFTTQNICLDICFLFPDHSYLLILHTNQACTCVYTYLPYIDSTSCTRAFAINKAAQHHSTIISVPMRCIPTFLLRPSLFLETTWCFVLVHSFHLQLSPSPVPFFHPACNFSITNLHLSPTLL